jgi:adenylate cyclase
LAVLLVGLVLIGLPLATWLDLRDITQTNLQRQAVSLSTVISGIRAFYASDVVDRVLAAHGHAFVTAHYREVPGGIPIPAKFSLELQHVMGADQASYRYRFVSPWPFRGTAPHPFNAFETASLAAFQRDPHHTGMTNVTWNSDGSQVSYSTPIIMEAGCVACHNASPDSPRHDWKVGDVRGIQELIVTQPYAYNIGEFRYLLMYFAFLAIAGLGFIIIQRRQWRFFSTISQQISKYLSPQIYEAIFSGRAGTEIRTQRKKLTIFFSDIKDFTSTTERLQPEVLTSILNEYFTEMSAIALAHGGTIDKFVGDAIVIFFGDPESRGDVEDARACVAMALAMQERLTGLNARWRSQGIEHPFQVRMGINTGYCNVGNFGSAERIDYTIIGAEANLAARLQSIAQPGTVVLSYETYALVRDVVHAHPLEPIHVKGIARQVVPYAVEGGVADEAERTVFADRERGLELYLDVDRVEDPAAARALLEAALRALRGKA